MLQVISDQAEVDRFQVIFERNLTMLAKLQKFRIRASYHGGHRDGEGAFSLEFHIWWVHRVIERSRYWNVFGLGVPREFPRQNKIACEINFPLSSPNKRIACVFARDEHGQIFILHRGRIAGGKPGVGTLGFWNYFRREAVPALEDGEIERFAVVANLHGQELLKDVAEFVREVERVKEVIASDANAAIPDPGFAEEFEGTRSYNLPGTTIEANVDHGRVVNALAERFESLGYTVKNDRHMDLYVGDTRRSTIALFEVKTDSRSTSIYQAVGQLYYNSRVFTVRPKLVAVLPSNTSSEVRRVLTSLEIGCLSYRMSAAKTPSFDETPESFV